MNYNFSDDVQRVLKNARVESDRLHHDYIGTEHILLSLLHEGESEAVSVLKKLNVDIEAIRDRIEGSIRPGRTTQPRSLAKVIPPIELPYTSRGKRVIDEAMSEARDSTLNSIGTSHLLLGMLKDDHSIATVVLKSLGITLDNVRAELHKMPPPLST